MREEGFAGLAEEALRRGREFFVDKEAAGSLFDSIPNAVWAAVDVSEQYGTLRERMAILMLADAFFRAQAEMNRPDDYDRRDAMRSARSPCQSADL